MTEPMPHEPLDEVDHQILRHLRLVHEEIDPPPEDLAERMKFALSWAALEADVAQLQELSGAGVRAEAAYGVTDTLTFTADSLSLMVTVTVTHEGGAREGGTVRVDGWVTDGGRLVELSVGTARYPATADLNGRLVWEGVPRGRAQFLIHPLGEGARPVVTPTVEL
ncbi:MAG: hypothetical protein ACR2FV_15980 [Ornithinimicrobium sp.]|jgi:hypothetical protein|uniref:hypothetical protein n=1 Tax=Ornithinimicrobium sp. TaxID=1977084 RepID=UPI0017E9BCCF|nr:hypothetical protein [Actinomycetota bacterium]